MSEEPKIVPDFPASLAEDFEKIGNHVTQSNDSIEFAHAFFDKFAKLQKTFAKGIEDLCNSRQAKLKGMFGNDAVEPVEQLKDSWNKFISDLKKMSDYYNEAADGIQETAVAPLATYLSTDTKAQVSNATTGKKAVKELKSAHSKVFAEGKRYHRTCNDMAARKEKLVKKGYDAEKLSKDSDMKKFGTNKDKERDSYQASIESYKTLTQETFTTALPKLMDDMKTQELKRIQAVKSSVVQAMDAMTRFANSIDFPEASESFRNLNEAASETFVTSFEEPSMPEFQEGVDEDGNQPEPSKSEEATTDEATDEATVEAEKDEGESEAKKEHGDAAGSTSEKKAEYGIDVEEAEKETEDDDL